MSWQNYIPSNFNLRLRRSISLVSTPVLAFSALSSLIMQDQNARNIPDGVFFGYRDGVSFGYRGGLYRRYHKRSNSIDMDYRISRTILPGSLRGASNALLASAKE